MSWQLQSGMLSRAALDALAAGIPLGIGGTPVTTATEAVAYAGFTVAAAGGTAPYTYSVASGTLPAGITLNSSSGAVSGTPTTAGTYASIVIRATDAVSATADLAAFTITVAAGATWDAATATAVTLSGGNLVATNTGTTSTDQGARVATSAGKTTGKYYFEITWTTLTNGGNRGFGIGTTASTYTNMGNSATAGAMIFRSGNIWSNGINTTATLGSQTAGTAVGIAVDLTNGRIWFRQLPSGNWNNSGTANPATNVGGFTFPAGTIVPFATFGGTSGAAGNVYTANFGASSFSGTVPSGFTSGWTV